MGRNSEGSEIWTDYLIKQQILKDIEILNNDLTNGQIKKVEWHCFGGVNQQEIQIFIENNLNLELRNKNVFQIINY